MRAHTLSEALRYGRGIERPFLCPEHGDSRPSASVNVIKGVWYCYTCHAHGDLSGDAALTEPDYEQMRLWLEKRLAEDPTYPESWLNQFDAGPVHPYWRERVGEDAAREFRLGADPPSQSVTYPLRSPSGQVMGVVRRSLGGSGPKYQYPAGIDVGRLLFHYTPAYRSAVVLTEGAVDAIALWNAGIDAFAIYGSRLSEHQVDLIERIDPTYVYTCYDLDQAGWTAHRETERAFTHCLVSRLTWPKAWGGDIAEVSDIRRRVVVEDLVSAGLACVE